jgi:hypothetical protein
MPSKQFNMRLSAEDRGNLDRLRDAGRERVGMTVSDADLFRFGLAALAREWKIKLRGPAPASSESDSHTP